MTTASHVAVAVGAEGLRADLMLCRAAAAHAGFEGRAVTTEEDLRRVAPFVLAHRRRRTPFEDPGLPRDELDEAFSQSAMHDLDGAREDTITPDDVAGAPVLPSNRSSYVMPGGRSPSTGSRGRYVRDVAADEATVSIAVAPTAVALAGRRAAAPGAPLAPEDLRAAVREQRVSNLVVLVVDASASMGAHRRIATAKGVALQLLTDAYQHRDRVALVAFGGEGAEVVLRPTGSVEIARARLTDLAVGGTTPLADALDTALAVARDGIRDRQIDPLLVILTDGRATAGGDDPVAAAQEAAGRIASAGVPAVVVDAEAGPARLGLAVQLAGILHADCVALDDFDAKCLAPYLRGTRLR
jgi:magnesium chelatase subunit D